MTGIGGIAAVRRRGICADEEGPPDGHFYADDD